MDERKFVDADDIEVFTRWWTVDAPRGIVLISHGASSVNLTFVVKEEYVADVIKRLHAEFF